MGSSAWGFNTAGIASATSSGLVQAGGYNVLPAATVLPYAGGTAPDGFVFCQGQEISKTTYPQLYAAIADAYATQTNPTTGAAWAAPAGTNFRVPDYRGSFLRGVGTASGKDATSLGGYQGEKTAKNGLAVTNNAVTSLGMNSNTTHTHTSTNLNLNGANVQSGSGAIGSIAGSGGITLTSPNIDHTHSFTSNVTLGNGDNETRPLNKGVNYIIKY